MAFPKDLRQKMINLMYLVLMAMLAINIDPAALQGYVTINDGMTESFKAFDVKNKATLETIKAKADKEKKPDQIVYASKAEELSDVASSMESFIDETIAAATKLATNTKGEFVDDSKDPATDIMIGEDINNGAAMQLKTRIQEVLTKYKEIVNSSPLSDEKKTALIASFSLKEPSDDAARSNPKNKDKSGWAAWTFQGKPAIAVEAMLRQFKNDANSTESQILDAFARELDADKIDIPYDTYNLAFVPSSTYMAEGEAFTAKLSVGQSSSKAKGLVKIFVDGKQVPVDNKGFANYKVTRGVGSHKVNAYAIVTNPQTGATKKVTLDKPVEYRVAKPSATVSADAMNVFYAGLDNPVSVSATGIGDAKANCTGCTSFAPKGKGSYVAKVSSKSVGKKVTVAVTSGGKNVSSSQFRVMKVPDPTPMLGTKKNGGSFSTGEIAVQSFVQANLENFVFDAKFKVISYDMWLMKPGKGSWKGSANGPQLSGDMKKNLSRVGAGWKIVITNMKAKGPDGTIRNLPAALYSIR